MCAGSDLPFENHKQWDACDRREKSIKSSESLLFKSCSLANSARKNKVVRMRVTMDDGTVTEKSYFFEAMGF